MHLVFRRAAPPHHAMSPPAWQSLISPSFRLVTFAAIACYVEVLVADGHGLAGAVITAMMVAIGARINTAPGRARV